MKFTVEIDDIYIENDNLDEKVKKIIIKDVSEQIFKKCEAIIEKDIVAKIDLMVKDQLYKKSLVFIDTFLKEGKIMTEIYRDGKYLKEPATIEDYIKAHFLKDSGWGYGNANDVIKKIAENFAVDLKKRYDLQFAVHVVNSLALNGLLKDENVQKLLEKNS